MANATFPAAWLGSSAHDLAIVGALKQQGISVDFLRNNAVYVNNKAVGRLVQTKPVVDGIASVAVGPLVTPKAEPVAARVHVEATAEAPAGDVPAAVGEVHAEPAEPAESVEGKTVAGPAKSLQDRLNDARKAFENIEKHTKVEPAK